MAIKGYVVRCEQESGRPGMPHEYTGHNNTLAEAVSDLARAMPHYGKGSIFRVHPDSREERLPSYEEALGEIERVAGLDQANREAHRAIAKLKHDLEDESRRFQEARTDADVTAGLLAEARTEIERLRTIHVTDRAEMAGAMAEMKECERALDEAIKSHARKDAEIERLRAIEALNVGAIDASLVRLGAVTGAIGPMPQRERHDARCLIHDGAGCSFEAGCDAGRALMPAADPLAALEAAERRLLEAGGWVEVEPAVWMDPRDHWHGNQGEAVDIARLRMMGERLAAKGGA